MRLRHAFVAALTLAVSPAMISLAQEAPAGAQLTSATSTSEEYLNPLHQEEWVVLDADGSFSGAYRLLANASSVANQSISISLVQNGKAIYRSETDSEGKFSFTQVKPGTYGLQARSEHSMAVYALHVLPTEGSKQLDSNIVVYGTSTPSTKIEKYLRLDQVPETATAYPVLERDPIGETRQFNADSKVQLRGTDLVGRISRASGLAHYDLTGNSVRILQDGKLIGKTLTNSKGEFSIANMTAGTYDLLVAGKDGTAVGSFQAIAASSVAVATDAAKFVTTASQSECPSCLNVEVTETPVFETSTPIVENIVDPGMTTIPGGGVVGPEGFPVDGGFPIVDSGFPGGGFAGGGFGGGGGGFGGGAGGLRGALGGGRLPMGALLGIGGLAAGVAALAANDSGFNAPPASVIVP